MAYEALDFYDIDSLLTDEERMIRDVVRDWVEERILPNIEDACRKVFFLTNGGLRSEKWGFSGLH